MGAPILLLNGRNYSHSSLEITVQKANGTAEIFLKVDAIDYSDGLELALVRGTNRAPLGATAGDYEAEECTISMGKSSFQKGIVDSLGDGWMGTDIQVTVTYNDRGEPLSTDVIKGIIIGVADSSAVGPDPVKAKLRIKPFYISRNGKMPLRNMIR